MFKLFDYSLFYPFYFNVEREEIKMTENLFSNQILIRVFILEHLLYTAKLSVTA